MRVKRTLVAAALAGLAMLVLSGPAAADVIKVSPGQSIQAAVDKAERGDTVKLAPGTYQEAVQIKTDGITLKGADADETVIEPGPSSGSGICDGSAGVCVADGTFGPNGPVINNVIDDVRIKDLKVRGFAFTGVLFLGTSDQRVTEVTAEDNHEYGIAAFDTTGGQYWDNVTARDGEAGIYVGDSPDADAVVRDNVSYDNLGFGFFIRDAAHGRVEDNEAFGNCIGILVLDTPEPTENSDWLVRDNSANKNNNACPAGEEGEAISGVGIVISGAHRITLVDNKANGNQPSGPTVASAGIGVISEGGPLATDNVIKHNTAFGNVVDILWDRQGDNAFVGNRCKTSDPDGLCVRGDRGNGHHGDDDDDDRGDHHHGRRHGDGDHHGRGHGDHGDDDHGRDHHKHHKGHKGHRRHDDD